jgi:hypothetical protein
MSATIDAGSVNGGHFLPEIKTFVGNMSMVGFLRHFGRTDEDNWEFFAFDDRRETWNRCRRAIFWRPFHEEKQFLLPGSLPGTLSIEWPEGTRQVSLSLCPLHN